MINIEAPGNSGKQPSRLERLGRAALEFFTSIPLLYGREPGMPDQTHSETDAHDLTPHDGLH